MYGNIAELCSQAEERHVDLWRVILEDEMACTSRTEKEIFDELGKRYEIMRRGTAQAIGDKRGQMRKSLISGMAVKQYEYGKGNGSVCGGFINVLMARALSCSETNAAMGKICAAPTAGACGILPAVLVSMEEQYSIDKRTILEGLLTASGIGAVITKNATVSGAEGGCQAECGVAAAMASAAAVYLCGGTGRQQADAVAFSLMNVMGLICDPVAGLVQIPCAQRNASQAVNAVISADMVLSGTESLIPADEVIEAMYKTGKMLPCELKETALGGIAVTETGKKIAKKILPQS